MIHIQSNYTNVKKVSNVRYIDYILNIDTDEEIQSSSNINIIFTTNSKTPDIRGVILSSIACNILLVIQSIAKGK